MKLNLQQQVKELKAKVYILYYAYKDSRLPWYSKLFIVLVIGYALSPIDLIPDFIPVLGYLDDLILLPIGIILALKLIPDNLYEEFKEKAEISMDNQVSRIGVVFVIIVWIVLIFICFFAFLKLK
ncbi:YkvA family protein [Orenia marismortui]|uniref:YkvA family protein n=1 Tax=Orenia marismortui TaxID=46469 RepID=UPI00035EE808|nr:YkvA family protein [Orenia marismortui]